ncbi:MAG: IMP dehydrogenase [Rhodospirillaceae bacterium]|nr:IMP dehydrogenase [Rhodospirillaceae bacterium]|tara:strand:+ start:8050 stop:9513 length:1464 start_codon:yes stop_codon:yes gene_type:complete
MKIPEALTFDDILLVPAASEILPSQADVNTRLTKEMDLKIPLLSAAMDTVTESELAIAMAQAGGIGVIHKNMSFEEQANEVRKVKKFESGMVINPVTIEPTQNLADALKLMAVHKISGIPVVERNSRKLVGILTNRDVRFATNPAEKVSELMTKENLVTVSEGIDMEDAKKILHQHRIEKLLVVDGNYSCIGLVTVKDIEKAKKFPEANKDGMGRLRVAAATGVGDSGIDRVAALLDAETDVLVVDTAHGHSRSVLSFVDRIKRMNNNAQLIAGNIATADGAKALADSGADSIKIGIGPGSICTTRVVAGVGVPQFSAIMEAAETCHKLNIPAIADGGIKYPGDLAKAIAAGADCAMVGSLLAGTDEAPGELILYQGRSYKAYRGMGSLGAMARGSADRYFQEEITDSLKLVPEGIEGQVPYKGSTASVLQQLIGGLKAAMGYTGNGTIEQMQNRCLMRRSTESGRRESHVHDVTITREAPNYRKES